MDNPTKDFISILSNEYDAFSYSGRGMRGKECFAVRCFDGNIQEKTAHIIESYVEEFGIDELSHIVGFFEESKTDSLGLGMVIYFPEIEYTKDDDNLGKFKAGIYYIGDPCYVVKPHDEWIRLLEATNYLGDGDFEYNNQKCHASSTAYGDGRYKDNLGNSYGVDAGLIGIMPVDCIKNVEIEEMKKLGAVIEFKDDFDVSSNAGLFKFGHIEINTRDDDFEFDDDFEDDEEE